MPFAVIMSFLLLVIDSNYFHVLVRLKEMYLSVSLQSLDVNIIEVQNIFEWFYPFWSFYMCDWYFKMNKHEVPIHLLVKRCSILSTKELGLHAHQYLSFCPYSEKGNSLVKPFPWLIIKINTLLLFLFTFSCVHSQITVTKSSPCA